jgi:iron-sulfur cluster assembly protein
LNAKPTKAILTFTPAAVAQLKSLQKDNQLLKVGVKLKGCSGQVYTMDYITTPSKLDEVVEQDGVKVIIDSKALFSLIGTEMDFQGDKLQSQFIFNNPNIKETCGCGISFTT